MAAMPAVAWTMPVNMVRARLISRDGQGAILPLSIDARRRTCSAPPAAHCTNLANVLVFVSFKKCIVSKV
jgi:hypothetical protein